MTNESGMIDNLNYNEPVGKSHHLVLEWAFTAYGYKRVEKIKRYFFHKGDYVALRRTLELTDWKAVLRDKSVDEMWDTISEEILTATDTYVPNKSTVSGQSQRNRPAWMNENAMRAVRKKRAAFDRYKKSREGKEYLEYSKARNAAKDEIRKAMKAYEKEIAKQAKANPKAFYRYVNSKTKSRSKTADIKGEDGSVLTSNKEKADVFNKFFSSVFTVEDLDHMPSPTPTSGQQLLTDIKFTVDDIEKLLLQLKCNKSPGPDNIHPRVLKECADVLALPLWILFSSSLEVGYVPSAWRKAKVTPIFKKGSRTEVSNYRRVSLISVCCKTMEKLVRNSLLQHMTSNGFLADTQHGFVHGRSCTTQLLRVLDAVTELYDQQVDVDVIYLDFSKAFDTVPHCRGFC